YERDGPQVGPPARDAGSPDPQGARRRTDARPGRFAPHRPGPSRNLRGQARIPLPGAPAARAGRLADVVLGTLGIQSPREVLRPHARGPAAARGGNAPVEPDRRGHRTGSLDVIPGSRWAGARPPPAV